MLRLISIAQKQQWLNTHLSLFVKVKIQYIVDGSWQDGEIVVLHDALHHHDVVYVDKVMVS